MQVVACGSGGGGAAPASAPIRTLAYVVTECAVDPMGVGSVSQELRIQVGDNAALPVRGVNAKAEGTFVPRYCQLLGADRLGQEMQAFLYFKRLGVTPDGSRIVFEVNPPPAELVALQQNVVTDIDSGIYSVRSDATDLRRLGPPSREPPFRLSGLTVSFLSFPGFALSPDGSRAVFTDLAEGVSGEEAIQIFSLDVETGARHQLTHLPRGPRDPCAVLSSGAACRPGTAAPFFLDDRQIAFFTTADANGMNPSGDLVTFVVNSDGSDVHPGPHPQSFPNGVIDPRFVITSPSPSVVILPVDVPPEGPPNPAILKFFPYSLEAFLLDGDFLLQLTSFRYNDFAGAALTADGQRVIIATSADPLTRGSGNELRRRNPTGNCQIFSMDKFGGDLRQLTDFQETDGSDAGCYFNRTSRCATGFLDIDPVTGTLVFYSSCDPFGRNPRGGQLFAMRPDGSGLRQITEARGLIILPDLSTALELVGPHAYSTPTHSNRPR